MFGFHLFSVDTLTDTLLNLEVGYTEAPLLYFNAQNKMIKWLIKNHYRTLSNLADIGSNASSLS